MQFKTCSSAPRGAFNQLLKIMKLTAFLLMLTFLQVSAKGLSQSVTYSADNVPLERVFQVIKKQTGYAFFL